MSAALGNFTVWYSDSNKVARWYSVPHNVFVHNLSTSSQYYKVATHEIGHAIGWRGHTATYIDVMYHTENSYYSLTNRDIEHLNQIYH